jgi:hypothetical protein
MSVQRVAAMIAVTGAIGSLVLMLRVGHRNNSLLLMTLFAIWVLSPFVALLVVLKRPLLTLSLILAFGSLIVYGDVAFGPPWAKPASAFLFVPFVSWLLIAIAAIASHRRAGGSL